MSCYYVASAKALADLGQTKLCREEQGQTALQEARSVSYDIHNFFLSSRSKWWFGKTEEAAALHTVPCAGNLWCKTPLKFNFLKSLGKNIFVLTRSCVSGETVVLLQPYAKNLAPLKPKSIKEFQAQRIHDTARSAQVYLAKCICFRKRSTACLQCFWRPGSQKGNPKLTHRLAHNCLRLDDFLHLPVILSLTYGWLPLSSKCLLVQWELPVVLWQTSDEHEKDELDLVLSFLRISLAYPHRRLVGSKKNCLCSWLLREKHLWWSLTLPVLLQLFCQRTEISMRATVIQWQYIDQLLPPLCDVFATRKKSLDLCIMRIMCFGTVTSSTELLFLKNLHYPIWQLFSVQAQMNIQDGYNPMSEGAHLSPAL